MITKEYSAFFKGLEKNNNKEWFHDHKKDYENHVKAPFIALLDEVIPQLEKIDSNISMNAKESLFRINKDIRFSKDKTPYNIMMKSGIAPGGKRSILPGYYLGISADKIHVGGGLFNLKGPELKKVRSLIFDLSDEFLAIVNDNSFKGNFGELKGEQAKRIDKEYKTAVEANPYLAYKQFYAMAEHPLKNYYDSDKLLRLVVERFSQISKLNVFLKQAF